MIGIAIVLSMGVVVAGAMIAGAMIAGMMASLEKTKAVRSHHTGTEPGKHAEQQ